MITIMEAYNNGTLLQYIMDICCNNPTTSSAKVDTTNDYETNWNGHQPLSPMKSKDEEIRLPSATELRFEFKRRRRGVRSPPPRDNYATGSAKEVNNSDNNRAKSFTEGVISPHYNNNTNRSISIKMREKWQPSI